MLQETTEREVVKSALAKVLGGHGANRPLIGLDPRQFGCGLNIVKVDNFYPTANESIDDFGRCTPANRALAVPFFDPSRRRRQPLALFEEDRPWIGQLQISRNTSQDFATILNGRLHQ